VPIRNSNPTKIELTKRPKWAFFDMTGWDDFYPSFYATSGGKTNENELKT